MATWSIKDIRRPQVLNSGGTGYEEADYLVARIISSAYQELDVSLLFATYAGLQAEWEAGAAFTVADAAIDTELGTVSTTGDDSLPSGTRSGKEGYTGTG